MRRSKTGRVQSPLGAGASAGHRPIFALCGGQREPRAGGLQERGGALGSRCPFPWCWAVGGTQGGHLWESTGAGYVESPRRAAWAQGSLSPNPSPWTWDPAGGKSGILAGDPPDLGWHSRGDIATHPRAQNGTEPRTESWGRGSIPVVLRPSLLPTGHSPQLNLTPGIPPGPTSSRAWELLRPPCPLALAPPGQNTPAPGSACRDPNSWCHVLPRLLPGME